ICGIRRGPMDRARGQNGTGVGPCRGRTHASTLRGVLTAGSNDAICYNLSRPTSTETYMPEIRLGDIIDDYCVKAKQIMNHALVSMLNAEPAKVRCRTCHSDHDYRHEQAPPPKVDLRKQALFQEVLSKLDPVAPSPDGSEEQKPKATKAKGKAKKGST